MNNPIDKYLDSTSLDELRKLCNGLMAIIFKEPEIIEVVRSELDMLAPQHRDDAKFAIETLDRLCDEYTDYIYKNQ